MEWHSSGPTAGQTNMPTWSQVQVGMTRQQVYALMGKPLRETEQVAEWKGAEAKKGWPLDHPSISYWREYEAYFDLEDRLNGTRDFDKTDHPSERRSQGGNRGRGARLKRPHWSELDIEQRATSKSWRTLTLPLIAERLTWGVGRASMRCFIVGENNTMSPYYSLIPMMFVPQGLHKCL